MKITTIISFDPNNYLGPDYGTYYVTVDAPELGRAVADVMRGPFKLRKKDDVLDVAESMACGVRDAQWQTMAHMINILLKFKKDND